LVLRDYRLSSFRKIFPFDSYKGSEGHSREGQSFSLCRGDIVKNGTWLYIEDAFDAKGVPFVPKEAHDSPSKWHVGL
jgi:hypothetical protein